MHLTDCDADGFRELARILSRNPSLSILNTNWEGDISFSATLKDLGTSRKRIGSLSLLRTGFAHDTIGETLVRKNLKLFTLLIANLKEEDYDRVVNKFKMRHFGSFIDVDDTKWVFRFHASMLQRILTEEMKDLFEPSAGV